MISLFHDSFPLHLSSGFEDLFLIKGIPVEDPNKNLANVSLGFIHKNMCLLSIVIIVPC